MSTKLKNGQSHYENGVGCMEFLVKQARAIGFLISVFVAVSMIYIMIIAYSKMSSYQWALVISCLIAVTLGIYGQLKLYKVPGYKYALCTLPGLIIVNNLASLF